MKVTMYKAVDGKLFETETAALDHNRAIRLRPAVNDFVESLNEEDWRESAGGDVYMGESDLEDMIVRRADALLALLLATQNKRAKTQKRRTKAEMEAARQAKVVGSMLKAA